LSPSAYYAKGLWLAFDLWMALGGWFPAAGCNVWFVPDGFSRAEQECGRQSGAKEPTNLLERN